MKPLNVTLSRGPDRELPEADETLQTLRFRFEDGVYCDVTPGMKRTPVPGAPDAERAVLVFAWNVQPPAEYLAAVYEQIREMGFAPEFITDVISRETSDATVEQWLKTGIRPQ